MSELRQERMAPVEPAKGPRTAGSSFKRLGEMAPPPRCRPTLTFSCFPGARDPHVRHLGEKVRRDRRKWRRGPHQQVGDLERRSA